MLGKEKEDGAIYEAILNNMYEPAFLMKVEKGGDFRYSWGNKRYLKLTGYSLEELKGKTPYELFAQERAELITAKCERCLWKAESLEYEEYLETSGTRIFHTVLTPIVENGRVVQITGSSREMTGIKEAEKSLRRKVEKQEEMLVTLWTQKNQLEEIVEKQSELIARFKPDGTLIFVNETYCRYFGKTKDELIGLNFLSLLSEEEVSSTRDYIWKIKELDEENPYFTFECNLILPDGSECWLQWTDRAFFDKNGNVVEIQAVGRDITGKKKAEEELRKSEERYRLLIENANEAIDIVQDGVHKFVNPKAEELFECRKEDLLLRPVLDLIHPEDQDKVSARIEKRVKREVIEEEYIIRIITAGGNVKWVEVSAVAIEWEGRPASLSLLNDITELKRAEKLAKENEKRFRYIIEFLPLPLAIIDEKNNYEYINPKFTQVFGYNLSDIPTGEKWLEQAYPDPEYRREVIETWKNDIKKLGQDVVRDRSFKVTCKDGQEKYVHFSPVLMDNNKHLMICEDITERKLYEEQLTYLSLHDQLTGLYSRHFLEAEMQRLDIERQLPLSIIMSDLNGLKLVNDTYGHDTGDEMLKKTAQILKEACRREDIIARWGGDEFVILLTQTGRGDAEKICRRIYESCTRAHVEDIPLSLSLGVAVKESPGKNLSQILKEAEDEMYRQKLAESRSMRSAVLNTLLKTLEAKSYETEQHAQRMLVIAWRIGEKLGLSEIELNRLSLLITLHDIGKINIPEEILLKEEQLTPEEWEVIKKHPEIGYRIARATEEFAHVAEEILCHHERWDGQGYPQGLEGERIPLLARIASIADAYEVMSNGRPYKACMSRKEIVEELKGCRGTQFDPGLVDIFVEMLEEEGEDK